MGLPPRIHSNRPEANRIILVSYCLIKAYTVASRITIPKIITVPSSYFSILLELGILVRRIDTPFQDGFLKQHPVLCRPYCVY